MQDAASSQIQIRPPHPHERRAWRMLLPEIATGPDPFRVLVAAAPVAHDGISIPRVVGAIAVSVCQLHFPVPGPRVALHVIPPFRRRGIGHSLVSAAASTAGEATTMYTWNVFDAGCADALVWNAMGFRERVVLSEQEVSLRNMAARLGSLHERAVERGRIPADARLISLADITPAQFEQLVDLHVRHLGGTAASVRAFLRSRMPPDSDARFSLVLLRGERAIGFELTRLVNEKVCLCDTEVIEPSHRGRWANVWLKLEPCRRLLAVGAEVVRFESFPHNTDTRSFTTQLGGVTLRESVRLYRNVSSTESR
jgi:GNAT superfamily N-acetyltransferase